MTVHVAPDLRAALTALYREKTGQCEVQVESASNRYRLDVWAAN